MERERDIPDVFDVFAIGAPAVSERPRGGVALPGLTKAKEVYSWTPRLAQQIHKWREGRTDEGERPRTYDKFYQKTPGNFQEPGTDSAVSVCSSENEEKKVEDKKRRRKGRAGRKEEVHYSKTLTEHDIKHIERHLSMKRTIRKKIMRDLQQAFVQDPAELSKNSVGKSKREINLQSLNTGPAAKVYGQSEPNILDMLRDSSDDSGTGGWSPIREQKFRSVRGRRRRSSCVTSSSEDLSCDWTDGDEGGGGGGLVDHLASLAVEPPPDYDQEEGCGEGGKERKTFWQRLVGRRRQ